MLYIFFILALVAECFVSSLHWDVVSQLQAWQIVVLMFAAFRGGVSISEDEVFCWLREPFCIVAKNETGAGGSVLPRCKIGWRRIVGELLSCPICSGVHIGSILILIYSLAPHFGLILIYMLGAGGGLELINAGKEFLFWGGRHSREECK